MGFLSVILHKTSGGIKRLILTFYKDAFPLENEQKLNDPEMIALYKYCKGLGIDVGCGSRKTHPSALGIDIIPKGVQGKYGSEKRMISQADICASGDNLYMFADGVLDYVVSRHNLEHYNDSLKALMEWKRVLKKDGILGVVLPDDDIVDTIKLDPTHKHVFTKESFKNFLKTIGGFKILKLESCTKTSFVCIAKKR